MAFRLALIAASGALVYRALKSKTAALYGSGLVAASALTGLGAVLQLLGQVSGLSLLITMIVLWLRAFRGPALGLMWRHGIISGVVMSGLMITYPEALPFFGASAIAYVVWALVRRPACRTWQVLAPSFATGLVVVALLRDFVEPVLTFLRLQSKAGLDAHAKVQLEEGLYSFYLLPSGAADLWGLHSVFHASREPWSSIAILLGMVLTLFAFAATIRQVVRGKSLAFVALIMFCLSGLLFYQRNAFPLYKMAMYIQPFMLGTVATFVLRQNFRPAWRFGSLLCLGAAGLISHWDYVDSSFSLRSFTEIPNSTREGVVRQLGEVTERLAPGQRLVCDFSNRTLIRFALIQLRGHPTNFPGNPMMASMFAFDRPDPNESMYGGEATRAARQELAVKYRAKVHDGVFDLHDEQSPDLRNAFRYDTMGSNTETLDPSSFYLCSARSQSLANRAHDLMNREAPFALLSWNDVRNHLVYVTSQMGTDMYTRQFGAKGWESVGLYPMEREPLFYRNATMAALGRHMLFAVLNPSSKARFVVNLTSTYKGDKENRVPPVAVIGDKRVKLPLVGRGSARVVSEAIAPQMIDGRGFVAVDMGIAGVRFPNERRGLMRLWGRNIVRDARTITCFGRDISLISEEEYQAFKAPCTLAKFPDDLANPKLEYSGLYEDGWSSEEAFVRLTQSPASQYMVVRGMIPDLGDSNFRTACALTIDGEEVDSRELPVGEFEVRLPANTPSGPHRLDLRFTHLQRLPGADGRPVAAQLKFIGFEEGPRRPESAQPLAAISRFPQDVTALGDTQSGVSVDGWVAPTCTVRLSQPPRYGQFAIRGMVPEIGNKQFASELAVSIDGHVVARKKLALDKFEVVVPAPKPAVSREIKLEFTASQQLPAPDDRRVGALLTFLGFEGSASTNRLDLEHPEAPPVALARFPADLSYPTLEHSGLHADGWASQHVKVLLNRPTDKTRLAIRGFVPHIDSDKFTSEVAVHIDGQEVARKALTVGTFEILVPTVDAGGTRSIELKFKSTQSLPAPDDRAVGARLTFLGFETLPAGEAVNVAERPGKIGL